MEMTREQVEEAVRMASSPAFGGIYLDKLLAHDQEQRNRIEQLEDWRANVTVALQREGGAFFADVPQHIRELVAQLQQQAAALAAVEAKNLEWEEKCKKLCCEHGNLLIQHHDAQATIQRLEEDVKRWREWSTRSGEIAEGNNKVIVGLHDRLAAMDARLEPGEIWSLFRRVLEQGGAIQQDYNAGKYQSYEHYSARLDEAARERADAFLQALAPAPGHEGGGSKS